MEGQQPPQAQVEIVYNDSSSSQMKSFEESSGELKSLMEMQKTLLPKFENNINSLLEFSQRIKQLEDFKDSSQKELQAHLSHFGAVIQLLKLQEEKSQQEEKKNQKLRLDIIKATEKQIEPLNTSLGLYMLDLDQLKENFDAYQKKMSELENKDSKFTRMIIEEHKKREKDIEILQNQISFNSKVFHNDTAALKKTVYLFGAISVANFFAACTAFWMWWQMHRV